MSFRNASSYALAALIAATIGMPAGCTAVRTTDPPRTATEQFLMSQAASKAIAQLAAQPLRGRRVYLGATYLDIPERQFVIGEVRAHLLLAGVQLVDEAEDAEAILELRSAGLGIDRYEFLLGIPALTLPQGTQPGQFVPLVTPELAIVKNTRQVAVASIAYVAYWRDTGELIAASGPHVGHTFRKDWWIFGAGPRTFGDIPPTDLGVR